MRKLIVIFFGFIILGKTAGAQSDLRKITGQVSFISSQNIYVRFADTDGININDTLFITSGESLKPVLVVRNLSSTSCLCTPISDEVLPAGHIITARIRPAASVQETKTLEDVRNETVLKAGQAGKDTLNISIAPPANKTVVKTKNGLSGSISAASYSSFSDTEGADNQRFRYSLSLSALKIGGTGLSVETYMSFRHKKGNWSEVKDDIFNALKIYTLSVKYDIDSSMNLSLGRQFNPRLSSIGSFDGLQVQKSIKKFTLGIIGASRPDYFNYGFDPKLLQFGGFVSYDRNKSATCSSTSLAFMNQLNSGKTDRRFLYFQHSGSLTKKMSLFSSFEVDLFRIKNNSPETSIDLTSAYLSLYYRILSNFSVGVSYDARKNPVYYETFRTLLDSLTDSGLRQSYRLHSSVRITKSLYFRVQSSWRYLKTDPHQSKSVSGSLTYSSAGSNYLSATLSGDYLETSFINGFSGGISILKNFSSGKFQTGAGYNYQDYRIPENSLNVIHHTLKADIYWQLTQGMFVSGNYEAAFEGKDLYNRLYLQFQKRF